jgi:hypothetical protein
MQVLSRALGSIPITLAAFACTPASPPCPACPSCAEATPAPSATLAARPPPVDASVPSASASPQPEQVEDAYCHPSGSDLVLGAWRPSQADVSAALGKARFICAPSGWVAQAVSDCMARLDRVDVTVRSGVMDGEHATKDSCDIFVGSVEWNGRHWVTFRNGVREGASSFAYITSVEMTARGPVLSTSGCERGPNGKPAGAAHPIEPPGWTTFPQEVQKLLCHVAG